MHILMLEWDSFAHEYVMEEFKKADCTVKAFSWPFGKEEMRENEPLCSALSKCLKEEKFDFVFSFNFFPVAAKACNRCGVKYVSWIYDTPYMLLYSKYTRLKTNYIYFFDRLLWQEFKKAGVEHAFYLPMAAPVAYYDSIRSHKTEEIYTADISFVGSTYKEDRNNFFKYLDGMNDYTKGYVKSIMEVQKELYGNFILENLLTENIVHELRRVCPIVKGEDEWETYAWIYANYFLARKLTGEQRTEILQLIAEKHNIKLYSNEESSELENVIQCGAVDYEKQMPYVFMNTKINLNMTLRSIHSGIPLRAMDIMGCQGFLLTNYQADFLEHFEPDVDYVYYSDNTDLLKKIDYYLEHEEHRNAIAYSGYEKVKAMHTYENRVKTILTHMKEL